MGCLCVGSSIVKHKKHFSQPTAQSSKLKSLSKLFELEINAKTIPGGQQDHGHGVVLHNQGKGYQQTKTFRSGSSQLAQVVKEVFHFQIPDWDQNPIILLVIGPIPFVGLDLIDPRSS